MDSPANETTKLPPLRYWLLLCAAAAQLATVIITWELWHPRIDPPNLPLLDLPQISFGVWIVLSLALIACYPKLGLWTHTILLIVASVFDQFRMQPQLLAILMLMFAAAYPLGLRIGRWFLAALWLWAGVHKLLSPHWFAHASYWMLTGMNLEEATADYWHWYYAVAIAVGEIGIGVVAIIRPRLAAYLCVLLHLTIFVLLIAIEWNYSVLPWNLATAIVGTWIMWRAGGQMDDAVVPHRWLEYSVAALLFVAPAGFFWGLLDHGYSNVLYSDFVPRGLITSPDTLREISGWAPLHVPFPYERRTHRQFFEAVANEGDKLHIHDPRPALDDQYFLMSGGHARPIEKREFFAQQEGTVAGVAIDDRHARFRLRKLGLVTQRWYRDIESDHRDKLISYAYTLKPEDYSADVLKLLPGLPNLEQLQLVGCPVSDDDLKLLSGLKRLQGIGLSGTAITDDGLKHLESLPDLKLLQIEDTQVSPAGWSRLQGKLGR